MIDDLLDQAREELKRADHSLYISLKYTRTVDIIKSVIIRLINSFDLTITAILEYLQEKKRIKVIPTSSRPRADIVAKKFPQFKHAIDFYYFLRDVNKATFEKKEEYKKNVTLIVNVHKERVDVDIERLKQYYNNTFSFVNSVYDTITK